MSKTHLHHQLVPKDHCLRTHAQTAQGVLDEDVRSRVVDHELGVEVLEVVGDRADQAQVLLVGCGALDWQILDDCFFDISVIGVDAIVIAINNIDVFFQHEIPLVAVPLVGVEVYYHYSFDRVPRLQVMHCQRDVGVDAETAAAVETSVMETA